MESGQGKIYLDTFVFMDILSGEAVAEKARSYLEEAKQKGGVVSAAVFTELAYHVRHRVSREKAEEILFYVVSLPNVEVVPVTVDIAKHAGMLRAKYRKMRLPKRLTYLDCIHLATALSSKCSRFVTGDRDFRGISEIDVEIY